MPKLLEGTFPCFDQRLTFNITLAKTIFRHVPSQIH